MKPKSTNSNYQLIIREDFEAIEDFRKFLNWTSGEFVLYQQETEDGLKVYFPNGFFQMELINESNVECEIILKSNCKRTIIQISNQLNSVTNHFKKFKISS